MENSPKLRAEKWSKLQISRNENDVDHDMGLEYDT